MAAELLMFQRGGGRVECSLNGAARLGCGLRRWELVALKY